MGPPLLQKISLNQGTKQNTPQFSSKQDSFRTDFQNSTHDIAANELVVGCSGRPEGAASAELDGWRPRASVKAGL